MHFEGFIQSNKLYRQGEGFSLISHVVKGAGTGVSDACLDLRGQNHTHYSSLNKDNILCNFDNLT